MTLTNPTIKENSAPRTANVKVRSLHLNFIGCVSFSIVHSLTPTHIGMTRKAIEAHAIKTGPIEYGFMKLDLTPGGGGVNGRIARTDSGTCKIWERLPTSTRLDNTLDEGMVVGK